MQSVDHQWSVNGFLITSGASVAQTSRTAKRDRFLAVLPHALLSLRCALGTLVTGVIIFLPVVSQFLTPQAKFFAIIIPPLATGRDVGGTLRALFLGLPFIIACIFFATLCVSHLSPSNSAIRFVMVAVAVFGLEWGGTSFGGLGKKLASGLFVTVVLQSASKTAIAVLSPLQLSLSLTAGLACGYFGALAGCMLPFPVFSAKLVRRRLTRACLDFAQLLPLLLGDADRRAPKFQEQVLWYFEDIEHQLSGVLTLVDGCNAEQPWKSHDDVRVWVSFLQKVRYTAQGINLALGKRKAKIDGVGYAHYDVFRYNLESLELDMGAEFRNYFQQLSLLQLHTPIGGVEACFKNLKVQVLDARRTFIDIENQQMRRGIQNWPEDMQMDFFTSYAALANVASIWEAISHFKEPPLSEISIRPLLATANSLVASFWFSDVPAQNIARLLNCVVLTTSVMVGCLFVLVPEVASFFPSGISAAVTCIFVHNSAGFGSSLRASRDRLTGVVVGGTYSYFAIPAFGSPVAITAAMVSWVGFGMFVLGQDSPVTATSSFFAVALALYNSGLDPANSFVVVSNYLIANSLAVIILISVSSVFWVVSVFTTRPSLLSAISEFVSMSVQGFDLVIARLTAVEAPVTEFPVAKFEAKLAQILALQKEVDSEPVILSPPLPSFALAELENMLGRLVVLVRGLDVTSQAAAEHLAELRNFAVLGPASDEAMLEMSRSVHFTMGAAMYLIKAMERPMVELQVQWSPDDMNNARSRFVLAMVSALRHTSKDTAILGSRAIVRLVATCFALSELCIRSMDLFRHVFAVASSTRNKQKRKVLNVGASRAPPEAIQSDFL